MYHELRSRRSSGPMIPGMTSPQGAWVLRPAADFMSQAMPSGADPGWADAVTLPTAAVTPRKLLK
jgi:hypothetical protein